MKIRRLPLQIIAFGLVAWTLNTALLHSQETGTLTGQVFIVTVGGENIRLGGVPVLLYPEKELLENAKRSLEEGARIRALIQPVRTYGEKVYKTAKAEDEAIAGGPVQLPGLNKSSAIGSLVHRLILLTDYYPASGLFFSSRLPKPIANATTDADGRFSITVPKVGEFGLGIQAGRVKPAEEYYWMLKVSMEGRDQKAIVVSNGNLGSKDNRTESYFRDLPTSKQEAELSGILLTTPIETVVGKVCQDLGVANPLRGFKPSSPVESAAEKAIRLYPDLANAGSPFNNAFLALYELTKQSDPQLLSRPDWQLKLAEKVASQLGLTPPTEK